MESNLLQKTLAVLDFDSVKSALCDCCRLDAARDRLRALEPSFDYNEVVRLVAMTAAARRLCDEKGAPSIQAASHIPDIVARAEKGAVLTPRELLFVASMLTSAENVSKYGAALEPSNALYDYFTLLKGDRALAEAINHAIVSEEQISDRASSALYDIRRKIQRMSAKIRETMQQYLVGSRSAYLQDPIITIRSGRFVLPVKVEHKSDIPGLVHDTSASGATIFVEPMPVVELNNEIKILENEEEKEIERILSELSVRCAGLSHLLLTDFSCLVELAVQFAKAEYAFRLEAVAVACERSGKSVLIGARHPLLDRSKVVPVNLSVGADYDTLVVTGPNTGGKTVTLKTLGLFALMNQCGLQLPVKEGSCIGFYPMVLADIGDEQSIEQSLSTFSAHMVNIVAMLKELKQGALILFDELGAGTDPLEGAALAVAILEDAREKGAFCLATTHYAELKAYALQTPGVENASCEFDLRSLRPTYRLITGVPGRSNAFRIAERLGLSRRVIESAGALLNSDSLRFEEVVSKLESERIKMEEKLDSAVLANRKAQSARAEAERRAETILQNAEKEAKRLTAESRRLLETARRASEEAFAEIARLEKAAKEKREAQLAEEARNNFKQIFRQADEKMDEIHEEVPVEPLERALVVGDRVQVAGTAKTGVVEKIRGNEITVKTDTSRIRLPLERIILLGEVQKKKEKKASSRVQSGVSKQTIKTEVDLRGMIGDDAWFVVDKYLDDARLAGLDNVRLIHGKGTGALRQHLWRLLKHDPRITDMRMGVFGEGDSGVTIVSLK